MRRDFENYFTKLQLNYNSVMKTYEKVKDDYTKGLVTEEQLVNFSKYIDVVKVNYDRTSYMRYLLRLPPKFIQKIEEKRINSKIMREARKYAAQNADKESVLQENRDAIDSLEKEVNNG